MVCSVEIVKSTQCIGRHACRLFHFSWEHSGTQGLLPKPHDLVQNPTVKKNHLNPFVNVLDESSDVLHFRTFSSGRVPAMLLLNVGTHGFSLGCPTAFASQSKMGVRCDVFAC